MIHSSNKGSWIARHKHKIGLIAVGHSAKKVEEHLVDWILYGIVVAYATSVWGTLWGSLAAFAVMTPITGILCLLYIRLYDWAGKDWFGLEALKEIREDQASGGWFSRLMYRIARHGNGAAFFALSLYGDAFMTTIYLRKGSHAYAGLTRRDHMIFWSSLIVSNAYWTLRWTVIVTVVLWILQYFGVQWI